jgi:glycosyltransferase involved in cell wall biosynthesis
MNTNFNSVVLVSFLIPTYNRANLLPQCIESILSQTYKNIEIIVIDDASTDGTEDVINSKFKGRVKYYKNNVNRGVAYSRNLGLSYANGKYIGLLDSDDLLCESDCVEIALKVLDSNPEIGVFTCDAYCIDLKGNKIYEKTFFQTTIDHRNIKLSSGIKDFDYVFCHGVHSCGAIFRKDITKEIGFLNTDYKITWDEDFFLRIAADSRFKIYYHNAPLAGYRIHNNSFSSNLSELYREKIKARYSIIESNRHLKARLGKKFNRRIADQYYCLADAYAKENKLLFSLAAALKAIIIYPPIILASIAKILDSRNKSPEAKALKR